MLAGVTTTTVADRAAEQAADAAKTSATAAIVLVCVTVVYVIITWFIARATSKAARSAARGADGQLVLLIANILQSEQMRMDRRALYQSPTWATPTSWTEDQDRACERVAQAFNTIGFMIEEGLLDPKLVVNNWGRSVVDSWARSANFVRSRREAEAYPQLWESFEKLERRASARFKPQDWAAKNQPAPEDIDNVN